MSSSAISEESVPFGSDVYWVMLALLLFSRGMDFLSTRVATPNLIHEANPIARKLGWKWGGIVNVGVCIIIASWPLSSIVVMTTSLLVAARNFKSAWIMRSMGEENYRMWLSAVLDHTGARLLISCLIGETGLTILIGSVLVYFTYPQVVPLAIGMGIIAYGAAVAFYTLLSLWRARHRWR